jgi:hypothetical protein
MGTLYKIDSRTLVFAPSGQGFFYSNLPARSHSVHQPGGLGGKITAGSTHEADLRECYQDCRLSRGSIRIELPYDKLYQVPENQAAMEQLS